MALEPTAAAVELTPAQQRLIANVSWLAKQNAVSIKRMAGMADLGYQTVRNWLEGSAHPTLGNMEKLAEVLGVEVGDLLLPTEELQVKVEEVGLRPFSLARPTIIKGDFGSGSKPRSSRLKRT